MDKISSSDFKKKFGEHGVSKFTEAPKEGGYLSRIGNDVKSSIGEASQSLTASAEGRMNPILSGFNIAKNVSSALVSPIAQSPGFKQLGEGFGKAGQAIVNTGIGNKATDFLSKKLSPETLGAVSDVAQTGLNVAAVEGTPRMFEGGFKSANNLLNKSANAVTDAIPSGGGGNLSPDIMNRVARLNPTDANKFKNMAGKSHGEYLTETGNFGAPDKVVANEAQKFAQSKLDVDNALGDLPGTYKAGPIKDALADLYLKGKTASTESVKSPYLDRVTELANKFNKEGLTMKEINEVKRLYEKNVKLGYNKLTNPDKVERSTNIDNAVREWQVKQADQLGFENIKEMNKQTQLSKFIVDKLGSQITGKSGLNNISLTDWIVLSGGDPTAIAGFLTKKFLSSAGVQAKVAELMSNGEPKGPVKPKLGETKYLRLPAGQTETPTVTKPINMPSQKAINSGTEIVPRASEGRAMQQSPQQSQTISKGPFNDTTTNTQNTQAKSNSSATTNSTSNRAIDNNVPQKKGFFKGVSDSIKNTPNKQGGFINFTPESVAKNVDATDVKLIKDYLGKNDVDTYIKVQPMLEAMGLKGMDSKTLQRFLTEVLDLSNNKKK